MADADPANQVVPYPVRRAIAVAEKHPSVLKVSSLTWHGKEVVSFEVVLAVAMPSKWKARGQSPSGVLIEEPVRFSFDIALPTDAPSISFRPDFSRDFPHIQPWLTGDGRPVPCIIYGDLEEFYLHQGMVGIINQTAAWLENAAEQSLIDHKQGWEVARRDHLADYIVADATVLRGSVAKVGNYQFFAYHYYTHLNSQNRRYHQGVVQAPIGITKNTINRHVAPTLKLDKPGFIEGQSLAVTVWPDRTRGKLPVFDRYLPETVTSLKALKDLARRIGCEQPLKLAFRNFEKHLQDLLKEISRSGPLDLNGRAVPLAVFLCVRRPCRLIGSDSDIELLPYVVECAMPDLFPLGDETPVWPAGHRDKIAPGLLAHLSGEDQEQRAEWTLLGAGSLGSKVALHLARAGRGPTSIIDDANMSPHNAARHALIPPNDDLQLAWLSGKAVQLKKAMAGLGQLSVALDEKIGDVVRTPALRKNAWSTNSWALVNTTASLSARDCLASAPLSELPCRVVESILYGDGAVGVVTAEGPNRNPNTRDLITDFYAVAQADTMLRPKIYRDGDDLARVTIGEGCGSTTMRMSDGRLSIMAAGAAEYILQKQRYGLPSAGGEIVIGQLDALGLGASWHTANMPPVTIVRPEKSPEWEVRVHERAMSKIRSEVANWSKVETGGILVGRISELARVINIVDVLGAPADSQRSAAEFVLGKAGVQRALKRYAESTNFTLCCLGTWHSHIQPGGPSALDRQTAKALALARLAPSVLLIHAPDRLHAVIADKIERDR